MALSSRARAASIGLSAVLAGFATLPAPVSPRRPSVRTVPPRPEICRDCAPALRLSLGNVSVPLLLEAWGNSPLLPPGADLSPAAHRQEVADYVALASSAGVQALEDYVGWAVVEPIQDLWEWDVYRENRAVIRGAGLGYTPYVWVHNLPSWARSGTGLVHSACLEHHLASEGSLSVFSKSTEGAYERVDSQLAMQLGRDLELLRFATPNDFGEAGYPTGVATFAFPDRHIHLGFWVDEPEARAHFRASMAARYGTIERLNAAWGGSFESFPALDYPAGPSPPRPWLDFVSWYHDARAERIGVLMDIARRHFPSTPISLNFGFPDERIVYGQDPTGLTKMLASKGFESRMPNGYPVPLLVSKRLATAARLYGPPRLATEPANDFPGDDEAVRRAVSESLFRDLTMGVTRHFDYGRNYLEGAASFAAAREVLRDAAPGIDTALFFSTVSHRLDTSKDSDGLFKGYPDGLVAIAEGLRDVVDYDVLDERLLEDGFLDRYDVLLWPVGMVTEAGTLARIRGWVERGGVLVVGNLSAVRTVEGDRGAFADVSASGPPPARVGLGLVFDLSGNGASLGSLVASRAWMGPDFHAAAGPPVAPLDAAFDGVWLSQFAAGVLLVNRSGAPVLLTLSMPEGRWRYRYPALPVSLTLPAGALLFVEGVTGRVQAIGLPEAAPP